MFDTMRETLDHLYAEHDRVQEDLDRWQWQYEQKRRERERAQPESADGIRRSITDTAESVWLDGYLQRIPGRRMIAGVASTSTINANGRAMLARGCELKLPVPLMYAHAQSGGPIGEVGYLRKTAKRIYMRAALFLGHEAADYAWQLIKRNKLSALSCGYEDQYHLQAEIDSIRFFDKWQIREVSIVPVGANPDCHFRIYSGGSDE